MTTINPASNWSLREHVEIGSMQDGGPVVACDGDLAIVWLFHSDLYVLISGDQQGFCFGAVEDEDDSIRETEADARTEMAKAIAHRDSFTRKA